MSEFYYVNMVELLMDIDFAHQLKLEIGITFCFDLGLVSDDFCMILTAWIKLVSWDMSS